MAHRTRRRAVLRERRDRMERARQLEFKRVMAEFWKSRLEEPRLPGVYGETIFGNGRIRYDDLPDGPRVKGTFGELVFSSGVVKGQDPRKEQELRSEIQREWREFKADLESRSSEWKKLIGN